LQAHASPVKDMLDPRQPALARALVALAHEAINDVRLQPINLENHDALGLREHGRVREKDKNKSGQWSVASGQ
jgi:hypothetical protein